MHAIWVGNVPAVVGINASVPQDKACKKTENFPGLAQACLEEP